MSNSSTDSSEAGAGALPFVAALLFALLALTAAAEAWLRLAAAQRDALTAALIAARAAGGPSIIVGDSHTYALGERMPGYDNLSVPGANLPTMAALVSLRLRTRAPAYAVVAAGPELFAPNNLRRGDPQLESGWHPLPLQLAQLPLARRLLPSLLRGGGPEAEMQALGVGASWAEVDETRRLLWTRARVQQQRPIAALARHPHFLQLGALVETLHRAGTRVCLVRTPLTDLYLQEASGYPEFAAYETDMAALIATSGARWIDFRELRPPLDLREFLNQDHVNAVGAARFAPWLMNRCEAAA